MGETTPETTVNATSTTVLINRIISNTSPKFNITTASSTTQSSTISQPSTTSSFTSASTTSVSTTPIKPINTTSKPTISSSTFKSTTLMTTTTTLRTTQKSTSSTTSKASTIPEISQQSNDTVENKNDEMQNKTIETDYDEIIPNTDNEIEDEHEMFIPTSAVERLPIQKMQSAKRNENLSFIITTVVIAVSCTVLGFIAIFIVYKQYRKSTNPLNYKEKSENGTKRADEEFSEIRYLTSDEEVLDFSLASPTSVTDL